jgi:transposase
MGKFANKTTALEQAELKPESVQTLLELGKSQYYELLKYLGEKAQRENGEAFLTFAQVQRLAALRDWCEERGKIDGFLEAEKGALQTIEPGDLSSDNLEPVAEIPVAEAEIPRLDQLIAEAEKLAAQRFIQPVQVIREIADRMTWEDLSPDTQQQVEAARQELIDPKASAPATIAQTLLHKYRTSRQPNQTGAA